MIVGHFYFIKEQYFLDFPDSYLVKNKGVVNDQSHDRPCFYAFQDKITGLYWMIPLSSQVKKYKKHYDDKIASYGKCDTIVFGKVLGYEKAFLIQNMCPITMDYINDEYFDSVSKIPVRIDGKFEKKLLSKAKKVLAIHRKGINLIFPDVLLIEKELIAKINKNENI